VKAPKARRPKRRVIYREHSDEDLRNAIRGAIPEGGVLWDWLSLICLDAVNDDTDFKRGVQEGRRTLAGEILTIAMSREPPKVDTNQGEN